MSLAVPAVLPVSKKDLEEKLALFASIPLVNRVQIDVVDGEFASPASWPYNAPQELQAMIKRGEMLPHLHHVAYEIDLMCLNAERAADAWLTIGASRLTFHAESIIDLAQFFASVGARHGGALISGGVVSIGLALNIESNPSLIEPFIEHIDYVQFMGIARIGRQGQPFDSRTLERVRLFHSRHPEVALQVDGGVSLDTGRELVARGVSSLVVGSSLLRASNPAAEFAKFEKLQKIS